MVMILTWVSIVKVILYMTGNTFLTHMFNPVAVRLLIIADEHTKQDDHSNLPDKANDWKTDSNICVFAHFPIF